ncbi:MAG: serine hydrolase [Patescibacteria group bacterium]|jgi:D-alanyl-D-alanine endopeptidase (penicillin-binding protein 7)
MFSVLLNLIFSVILTKADWPQVEREYFIAPIAETVEIIPQSGGDQVYAGRLKSAADKPVAPKKINQNSLGVEVTALSGLAVDWDSGKVLWEKNSGEKRSLASLTKLMTALVFLEHNPGWDKEVEITAEDQREGGANFFLVGETTTVRDLFYSTLIGSINCSAVALARSTGLSEADFARAMQQKAKALDLVSAIFVEPTGLLDGNQATAEDTIKLLRAALGNTAIGNATTLGSYEVNILNKNSKRTVSNTDWLLGGFLNQSPYSILGGKTGYIDNAGYCLGLGVERGGRRVLSVMLGSNSLENRFQDTKAVVDWIFRNYQW